MTDHDQSLPVIVDELVDGSDAERQLLLEHALTSLTPDALLELEERAYALIERRYPDNPASLLNWRHLQGQWKKSEVRATFDQAFQRLTDQQLAHLESTRSMLLNHQQESVANSLYARRRAATLQRRDDFFRDTVRSSLVSDHEFQRQLALEETSHRRTLEQSRHNHELEIAREEVMANLARMERRLEQPHELLLTLYDLLKALAQYRMSLEDRALRNPALQDRLQMMGLGLTRVMSSVNGLIADLNAIGGNPPTPEQLRQQSDQLLTMAMEQMQQWQHESQQEPSL